LQNGNLYDDYKYTSISPINHDNKAFLVVIRNPGYIGTSYAYSSTLFWLKDKSFRIAIEVNIYSKEKIDNLIINSCEIIYDNFSIELNDLELSNYVSGYTVSTRLNPDTETYIRNYALIEKDIDSKTMNDYIKRNILNNENIQFLSINIDITYDENGEGKNWNNSTKYFMNKSRESYTPKNMWGGLT
jgi:hypothetical protein